MTSETKSFKSISEFQQLEELPDTKPLMLADVDGRIIYFNNSLQRLFPESQKMVLSALNCEPDLADLVTTFVNSKYSSLHFDITMRNEIKDELNDFLVDLERVLVENEEYCLLIFTSTEERKKFEEKLNNLHNAIDYGNVAVMIADSNGIINYTSRDFEKIIDKSIEQLYAHPLEAALKQFLNAEDIKQLKNAIEEKTEWIKVISSNSSAGSTWFKELKLNPVSGTGKSYSNFILTANDITHYILRNRFIKKSEEKQKSIINNISDLLLIVRTERNEIIFENANENFIKNFSLKRENASSQPLKSIVPQELYEIIFDKIMELNLFKKNRMEFHYSNQGKEFVVKITYTDDDYDQSRIFIINFQDITEQVNNEKKLKEAYKKELQLNKLKSAFLENMSHEIRTPATAILGYANFLEEDLESGNYDTAGEIIHSLRDGVSRLMHLIERIVELSMLEAGEYTLDEKVVNINHLIKECFNENSQLASKNKITMELELDSRPLFLTIDDAKMKKVINAIIDNAIKYNKHNGKVIIKSCLKEDHIVVSVEDTGRGIDEKKIEAILQPFVQEEYEGHKRTFEGAGLGLTLAGKLMKVLRGELEIKSEKTVGTKVILKFNSNEHSVKEML